MLEYIWSIISVPVDSLANWLYAVLCQLFQNVYNFFGWLFDPATLLSFAVNVMDTAYAIIDKITPKVVGDALDQLTSYAGSPTMKAFGGFACWMVDQFSFAQVVYGLYFVVLNIVAVSWLIRGVMWTYHQIWGSD